MWARETLVSTPTPVKVKRNAHRSCAGWQSFRTPTLPETNMETPNEPYKDYSPSKRDYMGFHVNLGECNGKADVACKYV